MKDRIDKARKSHDGGQKASIRTIVIAAAAIVVVGAIAVVAIYRDRVAPFRTAILVVGDTSIEMRYFLKRILLSDETPQVILQSLIREEIVKQSAPRPPYNIKVADGEVDRFLRELAQDESETMSDSEFEEWYRQQLNESRLSDAEFRDLSRTSLLALRMTEYLSERVPTVGEQVHLNMIAVGDLAAAKEVKERLEAGEDFAALAREVSLDEETKEKGGDFGWIPRGAQGSSLTRVVFDELDVGEVSEPLYLDEQIFVVVVVTEKVASREIEEDALRNIKARVLDEWIKEERQYQKVEIHGFNNGYDSETDAWVNWQLQRMKR